jgi:ABC-type antimicrobial peptide transport system permease subunit
VDKKLALDLNEPLFWIGAIGIIIFTGIVAGSYPALYLSSFNPVTVLKGTFLAGKSTVMPRHVLVVAQFVISILLISATIIVYNQIQYVKKRQLGYNPENLVTIPSSPEADRSFAVIKQELLKTGLVNSVTRSSSPITAVWWRTGAPDWEGKPADQQIILTAIATDNDFSKTMGIQIIDGKDFSGTPIDSSTMLLNKSAVEAMGFKTPVGMQLKYGRRTYTVIGVTDNVVMESPYKPVDPMMMFYNPDQTGTITLRLSKSDQASVAIKKIETIFRKYTPEYPFEYQFVDQEFSKKFLTEELISKITNIFAGLAIFICCLGIAGLASFTIEKRIREIGIRKVLGASVQQLLMLISKEFLKLVFIAFIIAVPLTWWLMNSWLEKYAYRIDISTGLFGVVGVMVLLLTLVIVSMNTIRAAMDNPVKSLRTE